MTCTHDGRRAYIGCNDGTIRVWDLERGEELAQWRGHQRCVLSMDLSSDESMLVSGGEDGTIRVWKTATGQEISKMAGHTGSAGAVAFAPGRAWIASAGFDGFIRAWNALTGEKLREFQVPGERLMAVAISREEQWIVASGTGSKMHFVNVHTAKIEESVTTGHQGVQKGKSLYNVTSLQFLPGATKLASRGYDDTLHIWSVKQRTVLAKFADVDSWSFDVSSDGTRIAYQSKNCMKIERLTK